MKSRECNVGETGKECKVSEDRCPAGWREKTGLRANAILIPRLQVNIVGTLTCRRRGSPPLSARYIGESRGYEKMFHCRLEYTQNNDATNSPCLRRSAFPATWEYVHAGSTSGQAPWSIRSHR